MGVGENNPCQKHTNNYVICSQVHCFHSSSGIDTDTDLGNRTSTGPTNQGGVRSHQTHLKNILVESLVKQIASAEVNTEHLEMEGRKLLHHLSSLVHHTLLESEGSRAPWSNDCKIGHLLKSELFSFSFFTFSPCSFPKITLCFTLQIKSFLQHCVVTPCPKETWAQLLCKEDTTKEWPQALFSLAGWMISMCHNMKTSLRTVSPELTTNCLPFYSQI